MTKCLACGELQCVELADYGPQPICHHFFDGSQPEARHPLVLGQCEACAQVQLTNPVPPQDLVPRFDWLVYNEPEHHLDELVKVLRSLPGISPQSNICGISHKDESTVRRLCELGCQRAWRIDRVADLGIINPKEGIETIQQRLQPRTADSLREKHGEADMVIARHVLEHTHDPRGFMEALRRLVKPDGYVVFEVPDCREPFELLDYTALWEDHTLYFDETSLRTCLSIGGFGVTQVQFYPAPYETALVAIAQPNPGTDSKIPLVTSTAEWRNKARSFAQAFRGRREALRGLFSEWRKDGSIALFGAGHHAVMFTNLMALDDVIEFVIDDHPKKCGLRMPGSRLPIVSSDNLAREDVTLCLSSLGAGSQKKVLQKHASFVQRGGTFAAIFPTDRQELLTHLEGPGMLAKI